MARSFAIDPDAISLHPQSPATASMGATAMAVDQTIAFRPGAFQPHTAAGRRVLAHELAHLEQQARGTETTARGDIDALEQEADVAAEQVAAGQRPSPLRAAHPGRVQGYDWMGADDLGMGDWVENRHEADEEAAELRRSWRESREGRYRDEVSGQGETLQDEIERSEMFALNQRAALFEEVAETNRAMPADLMGLWAAARLTADAVAAGVEGGTLDFELIEDARLTFTSFYWSLLELAVEVEGRQEARETSERARAEEWIEQNTPVIRGFRGATFEVPNSRYSHNGRPQYYRAPLPSSPRIRAWIERADGAHDIATWRSVLADRRSATEVLDRLLLYDASPGSDAAQGLRYFSELLTAQRELEEEQPTAMRVRAVFYPKHEFIDVVGEDGTTERVAQGIPWQLYLYQDGPDWVLQDITTPSQPKFNRQAGTEVEATSCIAGLPDDEVLAHLLGQLNTSLRFPEGWLHFQVPGGERWRLETTEPWELSTWFAAIGIGLAALGLILFSAGTATPGALALLGVASAGFGVASTLAGLDERAGHGMLTQRDRDRAALFIAADIASALSLGLGQVVRMPLQGGRFAALAAHSGRYWIRLQQATRVVQASTLALDTAVVLTVTGDLVRAYQQIERQPGLDDQEREQALQRLVLTGLLTGAVMSLAIRGSVQDLRAGMPLRIVDVDADGRAILGLNRVGDAAVPRIDADGAGTGADGPGGAGRAGEEPGLPREVDPDLGSGEVVVQVRRSEDGLLEATGIRHGSNADPGDLEIHERVADELAHQQGRVRSLIRRLRTYFQGGEVPPLSLELEVWKLRAAQSLRTQRLRDGGLTRAQADDLADEIDVIRAQIDDVTAALADPTRRAAYATDEIALRTKPPEPAGLPDLPEGHIYFLRSDGVWDLRRQAGWDGPRFQVEYDATGAPTGRATNTQSLLRSGVLDHQLNDVTTARLQALGYEMHANGQIHRPDGFTGSGRSYMEPLTVDPQGRIAFSGSESLSEFRARVEANLGSGTPEATRLQALRSSAQPNERVEVVEGAFDTGSTWDQILTPRAQADLRELLEDGGIAPARIDAMIDGLLNRSDTIKVILGTRGVRASYDYLGEYARTRGAPPSGHPVHHVDPLYLSGSHELLEALPSDLHTALHRFFDGLHLPQTSNLPGSTLQPNHLRNAVQGQTRPAAAVVDTETGAIRYEFLDQ